MLPGDGSESERTRLTEEAFASAKTAATLADGFEVVEDYDGQLLLRLDRPGIFVNVAGQVPDQIGHRQGLRPDRLTYLLGLENGGEAVLFACWTGAVWQLAWVGALPTTAYLERTGAPYVISRAPGAGARIGWYAGRNPVILRKKWGVERPMFDQVGKLDLLALPEPRRFVDPQEDLFGA